MPTVLRFDGLRVLIYPNDHRPPHVHVIGPGREAVFVLNRRQEGVLLRENFGFNTRELRSIAAVLDQNWTKLHLAWEVFHGDYG